jgi:tryptophan halogenase
MNKIVILGGGTAGLLAAIMLKRQSPHKEITVVESSKIGIIGVGEGSTEHWKTFMEFADISLDQLVRETGATYKNGICFTNWNGDNDRYWHALPGKMTQIDEQTGTYPFSLLMLANEEHSDATVWHSCLDWKVAEPYNDSVNQYHFDTRKLNTFFHNLAEKRGVKFFDDDIDEVLLDKDGFVEKLVGKNNTYEGDFFIDASGFGKVISSKLGADWVDCSDYLPMNSAIAFPTPYKEEIPPFTEARALSSGWMWRIPTQDRFGNGYVYCDRFISDEDALAEVSAEFDHPIEVAKKVKFGAGYLKNFWNKNCVSVGLGGMFVEPLEASSIGSTIQQIFRLQSSMPFIDRNNMASLADAYNNDMRKMAENIIDFIQLHYFTKRRDSEFWQWANSELPLTPFNKKHLEEYKVSYPKIGDTEHHWNMFKSQNFYQVMHGLGLLDPKYAKQVVKDYELENKAIAIARYYDLSYDESTAITHREALEFSKTATKKNYPDPNFKPTFDDRLKDLIKI